MKIAWWQWLPFWRWRVIGRVESADEVPERLPRNAGVIVGDERFPKWLAFDCPCRKGHRILLNADRSRRPAWRIAVSAAGRLSVSPSVDFVGNGTRCHYFIREGRVEWSSNEMT